MNADEYQRLAARTLIPGPDFEISGRDFMLVWNALGIGGEAGELIDHIKKGVMHQRGVDTEYVKRELGDLCWYIAAICTGLDISLSDVMQTNVDKLKARYPNGWDHTRSGVRDGEAR